MIRVKLYPHTPSGLDAAFGELLPRSASTAPVIVPISQTTLLTALVFLKDSQVRFKLLDEDGSTREWSPDRRDWIECVWEDG